MESQATPAVGKVKVKILKYVGSWTPGQVVEVDAAHAKQLCAKTAVHDGHGPVLQQKAMLLADAEKLEATPVDIRKMTQKEMNDMGLKNIVHTPKDVQITRIIAKKKKDASEDMVPTKASLLGTEPPPAPEGEDADEESEGHEADGEAEAGDEEIAIASKGSKSRKKKPKGA